VSSIHHNQGCADTQDAIRLDCATFLNQRESEKQNEFHSIHTIPGPWDRNAGQLADAELLDHIGDDGQKLSSEYSVAFPGKK
jgi:hypothetical protein